MFASFEVCPARIRYIESYGFVKGRALVQRRGRSLEPTYSAFACFRMGMWGSAFFRG